MSTITNSVTRTTLQVAERLVSLCRQGKFLEAAKELYGIDVISEEPEGSGPAPIRMAGYENVVNKTARFGEAIEQVHALDISDPVVAGDHFAVAMVMDLTMKGIGRMPLHEIGVYQVRDGKIVRDRFHYMPKQIPANN